MAFQQLATVKSSVIFTFSTCGDLITCTFDLSQTVPFFFPLLCSRELQAEGDLRVSGNTIKTESRVRVQMECEVLWVSERNLIMKVNYMGNYEEIAIGVEL